VPPWGSAFRSQTAGRAPTDNAVFGIDYLTRTACAKFNIFINRREETAYFYLEADAGGNSLDGAPYSTVERPLPG
jgi:hypothetical protein